MAKVGGNPNMDLAKHGAKGGKSKSPIGAMKRDIAKFSRSWIAEHDPQLLELFDFYKGNDTRGIDYLLELKNLSLVLKQIALPALIDKLMKGETPTRSELDLIKLLKETWTESHKLKYGDKKVIEHLVTVADIRKQMRSDKKIISAQAIVDKKEDAS